MQAQIDASLARLKDFQRRTVDYAVRQYNCGQKRLLVADEVGLGKTVVASGILARLYQELVLSGQQKQLRVLYICSNQAIAQSNINKLNFSGDASYVIRSSQDDRLTSLAYADSVEGQEKPLVIRAFTPSTSFDDKSGAGRYDERILIFRLLYDYADLADYRNSLKWILKGNNNISDERWSSEIQVALRTTGPRPIRSKVSSEFRKLLDEEAPMESLRKAYELAGYTKPVKTWTLLRQLCGLGIEARTYGRYQSDLRPFIVHLRLLLSRACMEFLRADVIILDEFQRYKQLIDVDPEYKSPAAEIISTILHQSDVSSSRILLLSATPFKAYTTRVEEIRGEIHKDEFDTVMKYLNPGLTDDDWDQFGALRGDFFRYLRHAGRTPEAQAQAMQVKKDLEAIYRRCMVRTERLLVAQDKDALIRSVSTQHLEPELQDIEDFVAADQLVQYLNTHPNVQLPVPLEYVKSSPYAMSFLDGYEPRKHLQRILPGNLELQKLLRRHKHAWVDLRAVEQYHPLAKALPNARLRALVRESVDNGGWKLLWIPPTLPYYPAGEPFQGMEGYSKVLVFSSWRMVPRMISTLVSYEAERRSVGRAASQSERESGKRAYYERKRHPRPQIVYQRKEGEPSRLVSMTYLYPSLFLARLYDPAQNLEQGLSLSKLRHMLRDRLVEALGRPEVEAVTTGHGDPSDWYWAAPVVLDRCLVSESLMGEWLAKGLPASDSLTDSEAERPDKADTSAKREYFAEFARVYADPKALQLPWLTLEQRTLVADHLVRLLLAAPGVAYLRTLMRQGDLPTVEMLGLSFALAEAFITMFNKPESIATVRLCTRDDAGSYLDRVLEYSLAGNLQAMLDEYFYLVQEQEGLGVAARITDYLTDVLTVRSSRVAVDDLQSVLKSGADGERSRRYIRAHFAADFAGQKLATAKSTGRQINIRQAFNSPFRPFVLATTSVGQEGLDFHLYCRKIFHWNLPSNAIDIEQREGRINRYKGLVIRQNLVKKYGAQLKIGPAGDPWDALFEMAEQHEGLVTGKNQLVPFWHTEPDEKIRIERYVPMYAMSRDIDRYHELLKVLAFYRITFGQPRQEELVMALAGQHESNSIQEIRELLVDLSPPSGT